MGRKAKLKEQRIIARMNAKEAAAKDKQISGKWYYIIKYIAIISMLFDHTGKVLYSTGNINYDALIWCNMIGRIAFPLFCFELVESYYFTKSRRKHLLQIGGLALISELPFDMAMVFDKPLNFSTAAFDCQNTCLTLFLGFLMLEITNRNWNNLSNKLYKRKFAQKLFEASGKLIVVASFTVLSVVVGSDYTWRGIFLIAMLSFARKRKFTKILQFLSIMIFTIFMGSSMMLYTTAYLGLIPVFIAECCKSDSDKGSRISRAITSRPSKYICRFFYPVHLAILTVVKLILMSA